MSKASWRAKKGSLIVVGTGIGLVGQVTHDALQAMREADYLFYAANTDVSEIWIRRQNRRHESLADCYAIDRSGAETYALMTERIVARVREGKRVCAAFYGHPGVLAQASHAAIGLLRRERYEATMLPGISSDACLMADLGVNPGDCGLSSFEATDFLVSGRRFDPRSHLLLWQIGALGKWSPLETGPSKSGVAELVRVLCRSYPSTHEVVTYSAARYPLSPPTIRRLALERLSRIHLPMAMILWVPPLPTRTTRRSAIMALSNQRAGVNMAGRRSRRRALKT
jgi:hypothetical protein